MKESEAKLSEIYHSLWEKFNSEQYGQSVSLFAGRLIVNGFDISWFENKVCLDAGLKHIFRHQKARTIHSCQGWLF
ncbi:MAG: hypothetical protein A2822_04525 [Candidatus Staskawiczbacteria bacterium RIFCSPHIGHO2_01_FULL_41_41]|uniref:Uncharacterized protein n=1 Tax=Candidatus Staskawiczbacteria bacterium RIFCSPHIGHO2_01_FULL_41_41 TaxID=1802203 RepID=A0A1G2HRX4_9BACT|nr:MAG: hypothetical protein A2822_04525 [Candidatus Staskawiczbacteria bacterium RIFCSPHIGHO2_01_FULL_41_41]HLD80272.1 hypothetical protein [Candidatus Nanoarchaeia archaeon]